MKEKRTFSIPFRIIEALNQGDNINKTITVTMAIDNATRNRRQFLKFVKNNLGHPWIQERVMLLSIYLDESTISQLERLKGTLSQKTKVDFSLSRTLAFVLLYYITIDTESKY